MRAAEVGAALPDILHHVWVNFLQHMYYVTFGSSVMYFRCSCACAPAPEQMMMWPMMGGGGHRWRGASTCLWVSCHMWLKRQCTLGSAVCPVLVASPGSLTGSVQCAQTLCISVSFSLHGRSLFSGILGFGAPSLGFPVCALPYIPSLVFQHPGQSFLGFRGVLPLYKLLPKGGSFVDRNM